MAQSQGSSDRFSDSSAGAEKLVPKVLKVVCLTGFRGHGDYPTV